MIEKIEVLYVYDNTTGSNPYAWKKVGKAIIKLNEIIDEINTLRIEIETLKGMIK